MLAQTLFAILSLREELHTCFSRCSRSWFCSAPEAAARRKKPVFSCTDTTSRAVPLLLMTKLGGRALVGTGPAWAGPEGNGTKAAKSAAGFGGVSR